MRDGKEATPFMILQHHQDKQWLHSILRNSAGLIVQRGFSTVALRNPALSSQRSEERDSLRLDDSRMDNSKIV